MRDQEQIRRIIFDTIDEINQQLPPDQRLEKEEATVLFGAGSGLDSLGLVNLIAGTEERVAERFGREVNLGDERLMGQKEDPFRTVGSLARHLDYLLRGIDG